MDQRTITIDSEDRRAFAVRLIERIKIDPPLDVTIAEHIERRSNPQNARLWLLHTAAADFCGVSPEEMHEDMLCRFFGYAEKTMPSGWITRVPLKRSSQRNKKEFKDFMEKVEAFYISELGVWLP